MSPAEAERLARKARQIAAAFHALPEEQAVAAIAGHINQFWAPVMRRDFVARFAADPGGLEPLVRRALPLVRVPEARQ